MKDLYSYQSLYRSVSSNAKGLEWHEEARIKLYQKIKFKANQCYLCGRQKDYLYDFIKLTPIYLETQIMPPIRDICQYCAAGQTIQNCQTGKQVTFPKIRKEILPILDIYHYFALHLSYIARFIYYYLYYCVLIYLIVRFDMDWLKEFGYKIGLWKRYN